MDRARSIIKVGIAVIGIIVLVLILAMYVESPVDRMLELVWKVLVLLLLADISLKVGRHKGVKLSQDKQ